MDKNQLKKLIETAAGRIPADLVIKNCRAVNVFSGTITEGDIAVCGGLIAGVGKYSGLTETDAEGRYASPGFIDSHIHIESSYVSPEEIGRMLVPHGGTTIIADPHEIVNVCGIRGLDYMIEAARHTKLDIKYMLPSCVPATPYETSGAVIEAADMEAPIARPEILGMGEFMNYPGILACDDAALDKILLGHRAGKPIDGHVCGLYGKALSAYAAAGIRADHESDSAFEAEGRLERGLYVMLREGSACHNLRENLKAVTPENSRRFVLCSDDRQPKTMLTLGHLDNHLRICVEEGIDPVTAIRMATLNASECFGLRDRGAIAPGYRADIVLLDDLRDFRVTKVWIAGELCADNGVYLPPVQKSSIDPVRGSVVLRDLSEEKLRMHLSSGHVNVIRVLPGGVVTERSEAVVRLTDDGDFIRDPDKDLVKIAVIERHIGTGNVSTALLEGYGLKEGAIAVSVAHDSHNIIAVGADNAEIYTAIKQLEAQEGGIVLVHRGRVLDCMPMPIAGLMSDQSGEWVRDRLESIHEKAHRVLGVAPDVEPVMTLTFMSLAVIPELKLTDQGLFDVTNFRFIPLEAGSGT